MVCAACERSPVSGPPVVLIVLDTFRADHLGAIGGRDDLTPHLDALAAEGMLFTSCFSPYPLTLPSVSSILSSQWPLVHRVRENYDERLSERATTLAEVFAERGYVTGAFVSSLPVRRETGCAQGFDVYDDDFSEPFTFNREVFRSLTPEWTGSERRGDRTVARAIDWLASVDGPYFLMVHLFDPHSPYDPPEPYLSRYESFYEGEIAYTDSLVARLLDAVRARDSAPVVAVVADHGEGLGEHEEWAHGIFVYDTTVHVPWILWSPSRVPIARIDANVGLVDVAPTLLDLAGIEPPEVFAGQSAKGLAPGAPDREIYVENHFTRLEYGWAPQESWISGDRKWIRTTRSELYDRAADPAELHDVAAESPDVTARLDGELSAFQERALARAAMFGIDGLVEAIQPEPRVREWLGNLGYISGLENPPTGGPLPDAKDRIGEWNAANDAKGHVRTGEAALVRGELPLAARAFTEALSILPSADAHAGLARVHAAMGRLDEARAHFRAALDETPNDVDVLRGFALVLDALGEHARSDSVLMRAVLLAPDDLDVLRHRAEQLARTGSPADAVAAYETLEAAAPDDPDVVEALASLYDSLGRADDAVRLWTHLCTLREWDPVARWRLGSALAATGARDRARTELTDALRLAGSGATADSIRSAIARLGGE